MTAMSSIPSGCKQTAAGVIPEEWDAKPLLNVAPLQRGFDLPTTQLKHGIYPVVYSNGVSNFHKKAMVLAPGVVTGRSGTIGKVNYIETDYWPHNTTLWVTNFKDNDPKFIYYLYQDIKLDRFGTGSGVPTLNRNDVHEFCVAVPPPSEQRAIATALSDVDALLAAQDKLIAKKRDIKQAAMQQLLTGKQRLPGFSGEWEVKRLGEVAPLQRGFDLPNPQLKAGPYPVVYSNGALNYHAAFQVRCPGVVTGRSGTIGKVSFVEQDFWPHNTSLWVTSFKGNDPKFIFFLFIKIGLERFATGSGVPTLNRNDVHAFQVSIPSSIKEQAAIAAVLSDMDADLAALEQQRDKTQALKQGMMQELLTGRIRLV
jgi:type I restriction enzyme S subunit